jgi:hypothetical protein
MVPHSVSYARLRRATAAVEARHRLLYGHLTDPVSAVHAMINDVD